MKTLNCDDIKKILQEQLCAPCDIAINISRLNSDTRTIVKGDTFVALTGERFDGHDFINTAIEQGASSILVEREIENISIPQIIVSNTRIALGLIARHIRDCFVARGGRVVGLTGSVGKTTNKQMLAAILSQVGITHATKGNLNNDLGVPFTWFDLPDNAAFAVIEMGANHQGEIAYLAGITKPDIAMITNAGEAHLEGFGGISGVAKGKGELFECLVASNTAVLNLDDDFSGYWEQCIREDVRIVTFSLTQESADVYAKDIATDGSSFTLCHKGSTVFVRLPTVGQHNVMNALGCAACALSLDVDLQTIAHGLRVFTTPQGRLQKHQRKNVVIIDDSYNANPTSMKASADIIAATSGYRIMVIGDMAELGVHAAALHGNIGGYLEDKVDACLCVGENMMHVPSNNPHAKHYKDKAHLCAELMSLIHQHSNEHKITVLVKGSRSMQMEQVVEYLLENL